MTLAVNVVRPDLTHTARGRMHRRELTFAVHTRTCAYIVVKPVAWGENSLFVYFCR